MASKGFAEWRVPESTIVWACTHRGTVVEASNAWATSTPLFIEYQAWFLHRQTCDPRIGTKRIKKGITLASKTCIATPGQSWTTILHALLSSLNNHQLLLRLLWSRWNHLFLRQSHRKLSSLLHRHLIHR